MRKKVVLGVIIIALVMIFTGQVTVLAEGETDWDSRDFWSDANNWYQKGLNEGGITSTENLGPSIKSIINKFSSMVEVLGTVVIVCVTTFLGIKYMYGSATNKSEVKESLVTLLVACVFFFGWNAIWGMLFNGNTLTINTTDTTYEGFIGNIYRTVSLVAGMLSVIAVIYVGIRYIFAGATGKAELKGKSIHFLIGFILAFCSITVLKYISAAVLELFGS